jgi:Dyp-type peroxidase family
MPDFLPDGEITVDLDEIQGNILAGFNKDHEALLFLTFRDGPGARRWLSELLGDVATMREVLAFNRLFKLIRARRSTEDDTDTIQATWVNVALTYQGLVALGQADAGLASFEDAFRHGMSQRAEQLGDDGDAAPQHWVGELGSQEVHGLLIIASDRRDDLHRAIAHQIRRLSAHRIAVVFQQEGATRVDNPGHEHFGFKDGISQPGLKGVHQPNPNNPEQGDPGQDLVQPGEFVLGYPTQPGPPPQPSPSPYPPPSQPQPAAGEPSKSGPDWTRNGAYLVFRRLRQDVLAFQQQMGQLAGTEQISEDLMGAKVVGRYKSGAPLEVTKAQASDPGIADPSLLDDEHVNAFEYEPDDADGTVVPRAAHIRKAYPRNEATPAGGEPDTQRHRLLRRGIPFGLSFRHGAPAHSPRGPHPEYPEDRGLLFLCYGRSIENQFELVQQQWVNDPKFPQAGDGVDGVLSQGDFRLPGERQEHVTLQRFVTMTGGEYFFSPSITALKLLAGGT